MTECPKLTSAADTTHLFERFRHEFRFQMATTPGLRRRVYRLRHDVYCQELGYEAPADPAAKLEYDAYDTHALHCLLIHKQSDLAAGCLRLVLPSPATKGAAARLPLQDYAGQSLVHPTLHPDQFAEEAICEVSRLAISPRFRQRSVNAEIAATLQAHSPFTATQRRTFPAIIIGLFLASTALVGLADRRHVFAMMETRLPRLLARSGLCFARVGETIEFHGKRSAYYIDQHHAEHTMTDELVTLYRHIQAVLAPQLASVRLESRHTMPS